MRLLNINFRGGMYRLKNSVMHNINNILAKVDNINTKFITIQK